MHPAAIQLAKDVHQAYLKDKGYQFTARTFRKEFPGGCVISRLRGCSKYNRDAAARWRFQVDSRILFDGLEYDPQTWPATRQPQGCYAGGLYAIEDRDERMAKLVADDICQLTDRLIAERDGIRSAFAARLDARRGGRDDA